MRDKMIKLYDYIFITDQDDYNYLEIGKVEDIEYDYDGSVIKYVVIFKHDTRIYDYNLQYSCEILMFKPR